jgi:hypothetical protein
VALRSQDAHRQQTVDWCDATQGTAAAFDFTTKVPVQVVLQLQLRFELLLPPCKSSVQMCMPDAAWRPRPLWSWS